MSRARLSAALALLLGVALVPVTWAAAKPAAAKPAKAEAAVGVKVPDHQRFVLPNGLTILLLQKKEVPTIAFAGFVRGGALADPADKPGVGSMVAGLLDRGAGKRNAYEFADAVEGAGGFATGVLSAFRLDTTRGASRVWSVSLPPWSSV